MKDCESNWYILYTTFIQVHFRLLIVWILLIIIVRRRFLVCKICRKIVVLKICSGQCGKHDYLHISGKVAHLFIWKNSLRDSNRNEHLEGVFINEISFTIIFLNFLRRLVSINLLIIPGANVRLCDGSCFPTRFAHYTSAYFQYVLTGLLQPSWDPN